MSEREEFWDKVIDGVKEGWHQGTLHSYDGSHHCLLGWVQEVRGDLSHAITFVSDEVAQLAGIIQENYGDEQIPVGCVKTQALRDLTSNQYFVSSFNDYIAKDAQDVVDLLEKVKVREDV